MRKLKNNVKGITLVALVVTIIVLLILAGATISILLGENGLITKTIDTGEKTELEALKEEVMIVVTDRQIDRTADIPHSNSLKDDLEQEIKNVEKVESANGLSDVCYVTRGNTEITVYDDGEILEGKISIWKGNSDIELPKFKQESNVWNWYIESAGQLKFLADFVNNGNKVDGREDLIKLLSDAGYSQDEVTMSADTMIYLMNNIDLGARAGEGATEEAKWATNPDKLKWTPIGTDNNNVAGKLGTLEGNNHTIRGVYVNRTENLNGIFGNSNTIQNLSIKDSYIKGKSYSGGIVGILRSGFLENCHNKNTMVTLTEGTCAGGIVGFSYGMVRQCTNNGETKGQQDYTGGIVGRMYKNEISECTNNGNVSAVGRDVGGIVGGTSRGILKCTNNGTVRASNEYVGGIAGIAGDISQCTNSGNIKGNVAYIGGIAGVTYGLVNLCINNGDAIGQGETHVSDIGAVGGIVGYCSGIVQSCNNFGTVKGDYNIGGIAGEENVGTTITECMNSGLVETRTNCAGGIAGLGNGLIEKNYNTGSIISSKRYGWRNCRNM